MEYYNQVKKNQTLKTPCLAKFLEISHSFPHFSLSKITNCNRCKNNYRNRDNE